MAVWMRSPSCSPSPTRCHVRSTSVEVDSIEVFRKSLKVNSQDPFIQMRASRAQSLMVMIVLCGAPRYCGHADAFSPPPPAGRLSTGAPRRQAPVCRRVGHPHLVPSAAPRLPAHTRIGAGGAASEGCSPGVSHAGSQDRVQAMSKRSFDGSRAVKHVSSSMVDAVQALEEEARARQPGADATTRDEEDRVMRVLALCSRSAKLDASGVAVAQALRAFETIRPSAKPSLPEAAASSPARSPPSVFVYSALLGVCAKAGAEEEASLVMRMMRADGVKPNVVLYSAYISLFATTGARGDRRAPYKAIQALDEMRALGLTPNEYTYSSVIASCGSVTKQIGCRAAVDLGRSLMAAMRRDALEVTAVPFNTLLAGCARAVGSDGDAMDVCWQLVGEMRKQGVAMTVVTYTTLIDAGARAQDERVLDQGMQLLQEMKEVGLEPNVVTFNAMFKAFATAARAAVDAGRPAAGSRTRGARGQKRGTERSQRAGRGVFPRRGRGGGHGRVGHDGAQARGNRKKRAKQMLDSAMLLLEDMRGMGLVPDVYSFNTLLSACACAAAEGRRAPKRGLRALELMQEANLPPSAQAFNQLLEACSIAEEAGAQDGLEIGLRVRALLWSHEQELSPPPSRGSFASTFVTPVAAASQPPAANHQMLTACSYGRVGVCAIACACVRASCAASMRNLHAEWRGARSCCALCHVMCSQSLSSDRGGIEGHVSLSIYPRHPEPRALNSSRRH